MKQSISLVELIIVVAIIGILSQMGLANYLKTRQRAFDKLLASQLRLMYNMEKSIRADTGSYVSCNNTSVRCTQALGLALINEKEGYNYCVNANSLGFCASARHKYGSVNSVYNASDAIVAGNCSTPCW